MLYCGLTACGRRRGGGVSCMEVEASELLRYWKMVLEVVIVQIIMYV